MISVDGSEAGGQLLRTAVALSTLTGKPFKITNIRSSRPKPGLKTQHLEAIRSIGILCDAEIKGLELGSKELEYYPKKLESKDLRVNISTAGSIGLFLQAVLIATSKIEKQINIEIDGGGTWNKWAPPVLYLKEVLFPLLKEKTEIKIIRDGFYPKGRAKASVIAKPLELKPIEIIEKGEIVEILGYSIASISLKKAKVAKRQAQKAKELIKQKFDRDLKIETKYTNSFSTGSGILLYIKTENSIIGSDSLGERGKSAESVASDAVNDLVFEYVNGAVDRHAADMLLPYMALADSGRIKTSKITHHINTNVSIIERFLPVRFDVDETNKTISCQKI